jgi:hypothetical protein|tara:strand:- start:102 stop:926 length:825 start_codon:yes stop_codon:yes gene_type:complete
MAYIGKTPTSAPLTASDITDGIISNAKLGADSVNAAKISDDSISDEHLDITSITGQTAITSLADTDKFLVSDASDSGNLKYVEKQYLGGGGSLSLLSMIDQDLGSANKIQFQQVFSSDYDYYKVIGSLNLGSTGAHTIEFRFLNSSNSEQTSGSYYSVAQGWRYNSSANDRSDWGQWGSTGIDVGRDIEGGSYYRKVVLDMTIHPDAYSSTTHNALNWNMGYTKYQGGSESVSIIMGYGQYATTTDLSGGGIQLEVNNTYDYVNMGIYGVKTTT